MTRFNTRAQLFCLVAWFYLGPVTGVSADARESTPEFKAEILPDEEPVEANWQPWLICHGLSVEYQTLAREKHTLLKPDYVWLRFRNTRQDPIAFDSDFEVGLSNGDWKRVTQGGGLGGIPQNVASTKGFRPLPLRPDETTIATVRTIDESRLHYADSGKFLGASYPEALKLRWSKILVMSERDPKAKSVTINDEFASDKLYLGSASIEGANYDVSQCENKDRLAFDVRVWPLHDDQAIKDASSKTGVMPTIRYGPGITNEPIPPGGWNGVMPPIKFKGPDATSESKNEIQKGSSAGSGSGPSGGAPLSKFDKSKVQNLFEAEVGSKRDAEAAKQTDAFVQKMAERAAVQEKNLQRIQDDFARQQAQANAFNQSLQSMQARQASPASGATYATTQGFRTPPPNFPRPRNMRETYEQSAAKLRWAAGEYRAQGQVQKAAEAEAQAREMDAEARKLYR